MRLSTDTDRAARFYELVWPHAATVLRVARMLTHSHADAEDLSQEAMLKAFRAIESLHDPKDARPWLLAILRHCHIDRTRRRKPTVSCDALKIDFPAPAEPDLVHGTDAEALLESFSNEEMVGALRRLPSDIRWTLLLVDVEGLSEADAARVLSVPTGTIKSRLHRGRRMLFELLRPLAARLRLAGAEVAAAR